MSGVSDVRERVAQLLNYPRLSLSELAFVYHHCRNYAFGEGKSVREALRAMRRFFHRTIIVPQAYATQASNERCEQLIQLLNLYFNYQIDKAGASSAKSASFVDELLDSWLKTKH